MKRFSIAIITIIVASIVAQDATAQINLFGGKKSDCDSGDCAVPDASQRQHVTLPTRDSKNCCKSRTCKRKDQHIHIYLTPEQLEELVQSQQAQNPGRTSQISPELALAQQGQFVTGPPTGSIQQASTSYGLRGLSIRIPEFKIGLPTLELPSLFRVRHGRKMTVDGTQAAFVPHGTAFAGQAQAGYYNHGIAIAPGVQPAAQQVIAAPVQTSQQPEVDKSMQQPAKQTAAVEHLEQMARDLAAKRRLLESKIKECDSLITRLRQQTETAPAHNPVPATNCEQPGGSIPATNSRMLPSRNQPFYNQRVPTPQPATTNPTNDTLAPSVNPMTSNLESVRGDQNSKASARRKNSQIQNASQAPAQNGETNNPSKITKKDGIDRFLFKGEQVKNNVIRPGETLTIRFETVKKKPMRTTYKKEYPPKKPISAKIILGNNKTDSNN